MFEIRSFAGEFITGGDDMKTSVTQRLVPHLARRIPPHLSDCLGTAGGGSFLREHVIVLPTLLSLNQDFPASGIFGRFLVLGCGCLLSAHGGERDPLSSTRISPSKHSSRTGVRTTVQT